MVTNITMITERNRWPKHVLLIYNIYNKTKIKHVVGEGVVTYFHKCLHFYKPAVIPHILINHLKRHISQQYLKNQFVPLRK